MDDIKISSNKSFGIVFFVVFLFTDLTFVSKSKELSISWNLIWLSAWTLDSRFDNLSNLKLISSNLLVNCWNWFYIQVDREYVP